MPPSAGTDAGHLTGLGRDVVNDVIRAMRVTAHAGGNMIKAQRKASPPRDVVIRTRRVPADANSADEFSALVEGEASPEDIHPADASTHHRIVGLAIGRGVAAVRDGRINGIALLQAEQTSTGLHGCVEIRG